MCTAVLPHAARDDPPSSPPLSRILSCSDSNLNRYKVKWIGAARSKQPACLLARLSIVSRLRANVDAIIRLHVYGETTCVHTWYIIFRSSLVSFSHARNLSRLLLNRSTCPTFAYNWYNEPSCGMECDIENKEDRHKNTAHAVPVYFSYLYMHRRTHLFRVYIITSSRNRSFR